MTDSHMVLFEYHVMEPRRNRIRQKNNRINDRNQANVDRLHNDIQRFAHLTPKKKVKADVDYGQKLIQFSKKFFDGTSIGGLRQILGHRPLNKYARILWTLMWLATVGFGCNLCFNSVSRYLKYDIKDSLEYQTVKSMDFPAITFCNQNQFKKSAVGGSFLIMLALASTASIDPNEITRIAMDPWIFFQNNRSCYTSNKSDLAKKFESESLNLFLEVGIKKLFNIASMGSNGGVLKCWWKSKEENCSNLFLNHLTSFNWCFTFNPSKQYILDEDPKIVGLTTKNYMKRESDNFGMHAGLKLLLNVNHSEYCAGAAVKYFRSSGYSAKIHDPEVQSRMNVDKQLSFSAGYSYDIVVRPQVFRKETESLGRCLSNMNLMLYPNITYFPQSCIYEEYAKIIWNTCKCYVILFEGKEDLLAQYLNVPRKNLTICWNAQLVCVTKLDHYYLNSPLEKVFPRCKVSCDQVEYEYQVSQRRFPQSASAADFARNYEMDIKQMKKDLILVNFYYDSMTVLTIVESQKYILLNVFRDFGGVLSLFLGMSVISMGEAAYFFAFYIQILSKVLVKVLKL